MHIDGAVMDHEAGESTSPSHNVLLQLLPLSPLSDVDDVTYEGVNVPLLPPISPLQQTAFDNLPAADAIAQPAASAIRSDVLPRPRQLGSTPERPQYAPQADTNRSDSTAPADNHVHPPQLLNNVHAPSFASSQSSSGALAAARVNDKRRRSPDAQSRLSSMKRRRSAASRAVYAYKTSSVGSQYQAHVAPWDANEAAAIQRERQRLTALNERREADGSSAASLEGQPYFLSSLLPDTTAAKCQKATQSTTEAHSGRVHDHSSCTHYCDHRSTRCVLLSGIVVDYWELLSSMQSYSQRRVTHTEALRLIHQANYTVDDAMAQLRLLAGFPDTSAETNDSDHVALTDPACTVCGDGGDVFLCDAAGCRRVYHAECLQLDSVPVQYECPAHFCRRCHTRVVDPCQSCRSCPSAFCDVHIAEQRQHHFRPNTYKHSPTGATGRLSKPHAPLTTLSMCVIAIQQSKSRSWAEKPHCSTSSPSPTHTRNTSQADLQAVLTHPADVSIVRVTGAKGATSWSDRTATSEPSGHSLQIDRHRPTARLSSHV